MGKVAIVTGGSSGLGKKIVEHLRADFVEVFDVSLETGFNLTKTDDIEDAIQYAQTVTGPVDFLINCAGINFIDWFEEIPLEKWNELINVNATSIWRMSAALIRNGLFKSPATICNIVSNASHMPMTNSAAYNASKGAAHILTLQMARELRKRHNLTVFGISPNKLSGTGMSDYIDNRVCGLRGWTKEEAEAYQIASLPAGKETDPNAVAEFLAFLLSSRSRHESLAGCIIPYGA